MQPNLNRNGIFEKAKENGGARRGSSAAGEGRPERVQAARCRAEASRPRSRLASRSEKIATLTAKVDVGFGNALFIRGEGAGLSWDKGQPLVCIEGATWVWSSRPTKDNLKIKLLVNDQLWCRGNNIEVPSGAEIEVVPAF